MAVDVAAYLAVLKRRAYRRFWIGFTLTVIGDAMSRTALMWHVLVTPARAAALKISPEQSIAARDSHHCSGENPFQQPVGRFADTSIRVE